ncbi:MAG: TIGR00725 family protein, partial [bacterium]|nr:TIGR00725 family protein [bacterium]
MKKKIIGIMGPGPGATERDLAHAYTLGRMVAEEGWLLLTGGMKTGVMDAASRGAGEAGGLVIGILPTGDSSAASDAVDIPIVTGMGSARNNINILSSDVVIACGMGPGTASEIALAIKNGRKVILLNDMEESRAFFTKLSSDFVFPVSSP